MSENRRHPGNWFIPWKEARTFPAMILAIFRSKEERSPGYLTMSIVYVVLMVELETLIDRDRQRPVEIQMGQRCAVLHKEFEETFIDKKHILKTETNRSRRCIKS